MKKTILFCLIIISCDSSINFCNQMDNSSNCFEEPETNLLNYYDFTDVINNTDVIFHVEGNNQIEGFSYNLNNSLIWQDTTKSEGIIKLYNLREGIHNILIRSFYPEGDLDQTPLNIDFTIDAISLNLKYENCMDLIKTDTYLEYRFTSDSYINGIRSSEFSDDLIYYWEITNKTDSSSTLIKSFLENSSQSECQTFEQYSDTSYYDVKLLINTVFSSDSLIKSNYLIIPPFSNSGQGDNF